MPNLKIVKFWKLPKTANFFENLIFHYLCKDNSSNHIYLHFLATFAFLLIFCEFMKKWRHFFWYISNQIVITERQWNNVNMVGYNLFIIHNKVMNASVDSSVPVSVDHFLVHHVLVHHFLIQPWDWCNIFAFNARARSLGLSQGLRLGRAGGGRVAALEGESGGRVRTFSGSFFPLVFHPPTFTNYYIYSAIRTMSLRGK